FARVGTATRVLDTRDEVIPQGDQAVRGGGKPGEGQPLDGLEATLLRRAPVLPVEIFDQPVGRVAELADVNDVGSRVVLGTAGHRRPAQDHGTALRVCTRDDVLDVRELDVH